MSNTEKKNHIWVKLCLLLIILGGLTLLLYKLNMVRLFVCKKDLLDFLHSLGPWGWFGLIFLQILQVVVAPIPGEVTGLLGGFLYGPFWGTVISTVGLTIGSYAAFALSRSLGRPFVERFVPEPALARFDYLLHHKGNFVVFLLFLIPGFPKDYLCYILGLGHMSNLEFLVIGTVGRLFGTVLLSFGGNFIRLEHYWGFAILMGAALLAILIAVLLRERIEQFFRACHLGDGK